MDIDEQVRFCRTELDKARRDFPISSAEVLVAENSYVRTLNNATCAGSPAVIGSDVSLTDDSRIRVSFYCDRVNVTVVFHVNEDRVGRPRIYGGQEAVKFGQRVADTGILQDCHVEVSLTAVRNFGLKLREYGEACL